MHGWVGIVVKFPGIGRNHQRAARRSCFLEASVEMKPITVEVGGGGGGRKGGKLQKKKSVKNPEGWPIIRGDFKVSEDLRWRILA